MKKRSDRPRRAGEQRVSFVRGSVGAATFEELARDAEGKVAFEEVGHAVMPPTDRRFNRITPPEPAQCKEWGWVG